MFVPSAKPGDGIGHIRRCVELAAEFANGSLLLPDAPEQRERVRHVLAHAERPLDERSLCTDPAAGAPWDLVVVDRRSTSREELLELAAYGPVAAIDEGGAARELFDYLIDTLPLPEDMSKANVSSLSFLSKPRNRRTGGEPTGNVLVTFGGEDPAGLAEKVASMLVGEELIAASRVTVAIGPLSKSPRLPNGVNLLLAPSSLREELHAFDIVFTSFGLTAYEALAAGVDVVLVNPTAYHSRLARIAGFPEAGVKEPNRRLLESILRDRSALGAACRRIATESGRGIGEQLGSLDFSRGAGCPVCGTRLNSAIHRLPERTFFRCAECSMVYEVLFERASREYHRAYFMEEYEKQYGRTYLDDFDNIRRMGEARLARLRAVRPENGEMRLLDVGCAYGPFLVEAAAAGYRVHGIDVAQEAVDYVTGTLTLPAVRARFEEVDLRAAFGIDRVDVLTMWYVIEHLPRLGEALKKVNALLPVGGIFAFSTPNLAGISGASDLGRFLQASPSDHVTLWNPKIARSVLQRFGFRVVAVNITGHHPERFPAGGAGRGLRYRVLDRYSRFAGLGDTFEAYAVKEEECAAPAAGVQA